jgi:pentatricopeptide repeat protein
LIPRHVPSRTPQWQPRATFISLRNPQARNGADQNEAQTQQAEADLTPENDQEVPHKLLDRTQTGHRGGTNEPQRVGRYSKYVHNPTEDMETTIDVGQLNEVANAEHDDGVSYAPRIIGLLSRGKVDKAWALFERTYTSADCEALTNPSTSDIRLISNGRLFGNLMNAVVAAFCQGQGEPTITPTTVLFKYEQLGIASPGLWIKEALEPLTHQTILATNGGSETLQRDVPSLLFELLSVWRLFFQCKGANNDPLEAINPNWNLPAVEAMPLLYESTDFNYRLQVFHPKALGSPVLGFCAIYLFNSVVALKSTESLQNQAAPFLQLLSRVLAGSRVNTVLKHPAFSKTFNSLPENVQAEIRTGIETAPKRALSMLGQTSPDSEVEPKQHATTDSESFNLKVIARAVEAKASPRDLENHWKRIEMEYTQEDGKISIPSRIYNAFLSGYLVLRQAKRSVEVWNHMVTHGVKPELQTWVAMLDGCEKAKDLDGFNAMWSRMQSAGFEPDNYAWTTRIHGLMSLRQVDLGLRTLDEMGHRWQSAETVKNAPPSNSKNSKGAKNLPASAKLVNNCAKPSVEVVNGAISALVQLPLKDMRQQKRVDFVQKILRWGTQFDVQPDTRTFNILMQLYLRAGDYATAFKVLKQMELKGIPADISTHTMLITAAFDNNTLDNLSEADQASRLIQMFDELEAGGLRLNNYVYATAVDRLLKQYGSHNAVRTIIDHMRSKNLAPSAHVYTSLVTYYFQQSPPAIEAVDTLLHQIFESAHSDTDKYLFDRTIEGYAEHGEVGKMMSVLTRMSKQGQHPGFQALTAVIRALVEAGDVDRARFIVRDVERGEGVAYGGVTGRIDSQRQFLQVAQSLGVGLNDERMGDMFKMRSEASVLDEQNKIRAREERERSPGSKSGGDVGPPEENIHGFLEDEPRR